ncbi:putative MFS monocarboxylate transporter [Talaromyces proteolyticus]|uniref:MFS monocarboxylate transporter n=1 Tax=Talaromyces proteolyticus TaxID=1131652 RepID=A0AAD4L0E1_9EURO|nr:putative MFS monocarboxylate transporter [Talaromyces proteolyticus]KAH8700604.1 putative MFS monocarboxylate transporter [Talaromyces proteolyticus]
MMAQDAPEKDQKSIGISNNAVDGGDSSVSSAPSPPQEEKKSGYGNEEHEFDGGLTAYLQVLGAFFMFFNSWGLINTWGLFQTFYEQQILSHMSPSSIAWIGSVESALLMFIGVITGPLFDAGYFYTMILLGTFMVVFGFMMTSLASQYYQIMLAQGICVGAGAGCLFVPAVALLPQYFRRRRALANGIAASGSSIGGVLYPIMFDHLQREIGFAWATRVLGFMALATCSISISVMRVRFKPKERRALLELSAFKEVQFNLFCAAQFLGFLGFYNYLIYVQPWAIQKGIVSESLGFYLVPILNAASTFGRIMPNMIADHSGPLNMLTPAAAVSSLLAFCWIAVGSSTGIIILSLLYGFFSGGFVSLPPVVMMTITSDLRSFGTRLGMSFAICSIALLIGTPIGGAILSNTNSYIGVQSFCGACLASCALLMFTIRVIRSGPKILYRT